MDLDEPDQIYLKRFFILKTRWLGIYVHKIYRPDYTRCIHNHPWSFFTFILKGGYREFINGEEHVRSPGYLGWRPHVASHRITELLDGPAWTLIVRFRDYKEWGFWTTEGYIPWREYIYSAPGKFRDAVQRVAWCADEQ